MAEGRSRACSAGDLRSAALSGGPVNVLVAFTLGGILTLFYLWRRDLVANIIAHFLVDFIANVVPRMMK